jgi:hypothetical protein
LQGTRDGSPGRDTTTATEPVLSNQLRRDIERWFVRRGVPQFIEGYTTEQSLDTRAAPYIGGWISLWLLGYWLNHPGITAPWNLGAAIGSIGFVSIAWAVTRRIRGRSLTRRPFEFDLVDIGLFAILPSFPVLAMDRAPLPMAFAALNVLAGVGAIYAVIAFGMLEIGSWALRRLEEQLVQVVSLLARTLPLMLILVVFLLFSAEIWEAAHAMHAGELTAVLLLLLVVAAILVLTTFRPEIRRLDRWTDWHAIRSDARETPAAAIAEEVSGVIPPLNWLQRRNLDVLVLINQLLQSVFVALLVMAFLVILGLIAVPVSVQEAWIGAPVVVVLDFHLLEEGRILSAELLTVSALLSGIVGLYFTGLSLTDPTYRGEHYTAVVAELRMLLSARAVYLAGIRGTGSDAEERAQPPG